MHARKAALPPAQPDWPTSRTIVDSWSLLPEFVAKECLSRSSKERKQKQHAEQHIHSTKHKVRRMNSLLEIQHEQGSPIPELLDHTRNHHQPEAHRIPCHDYERNLPRQPHADEPVIKPGMSNDRRIIAPDRIKHQVKRREDQKAPDGSNPENHFGKFHSPPLQNSNESCGDGRLGRPSLGEARRPAIEKPSLIRMAQRFQRCDQDLALTR